jgi:aminopeptidase-like protein
MNISHLRKNLNLEEVGQGMYQLIQRLYPICRSITGNGVRETLNIIKEYIPLEVHEVPTGTKVFDWSVPKEWNIRDAYVKDSNGARIIDFKKSNLHVVNYSTPVKKTMSIEDLKAHIHTLPEYPDWIPYRTTYYKEDWGF